MNSSFSKLERVFRVNIDQLTPIDIVNMVFIDDNGINIEDRFIKIENKRKFVESSYRIQFAFPFLNLFNSCTVEFHQEREVDNAKITIQFITKELLTKKNTLHFESFIQSIYNDFGLPINFVGDEIPMDRIFENIALYFIVLMHWKSSEYEIIIGKREGRSFAVGFLIKN